jgi:ubiquinone/menaquinone biosynthesis C-methylase UbiE
MKTCYLMENDEETRRLEMKTDASTVAAFATRAGMKPGMRVADVFCGPGLTTSILSGLVGPAGSAAGFDASADRIAHATERYGNERTHFRISDAREPFAQQADFDFAWVRFALEYFRKESFDIVRNVSALLKEGGILCLIDLDHNCLNHYGMEAKVEAALKSVMLQLEEKYNFDPYAGRKLYSHLFRLSYEDIRVEVGAHHLIYGELGEVDRANWAKKIETITKNTSTEVPGYQSAKEFLDDFMRFFENPGRFTYTPIIACSGRKAASPIA